MSFDKLLWIHGLVLLVMVIGGVQDWKHAEVSNWLSIPFFFLGILALAVQAWQSGSWLVSAFQLFVISAWTIAAWKGWMGGADWKMWIGLYGLWPLGGIAALLAAGIIGILCLLLGRRRFPGVTAFALGACLLAVGMVK